MYQFVVYESATGRIKRWGTCSLRDDVNLQVPDDDDKHEVIGHEIAMLSDQTYYVDPSANVIPRPPASGYAIDKTLITADGVDAATISGLPNPTRVHILNTDDSRASGGEATSGSFTFSTAVAGTYQITVDGMPYAPLMYSVIAK
jgi:hypothetical protein